jgi:predicted CXXCH cytochrome family protein
MRPVSLRQVLTGRRRAAVRWSAAAAAALAVAVLPRVALPAGGVYRQTRHGDPTNGVLRVPTAPRGSCVQCHDSRFKSSRGTVRCETCHAAPGTLGVYAGSAAYARSAHASPWTVWPSDARRARRPDGGECVACHDPHGQKDASGIVPALARAREEALCLQCHGGSPAKDVRPRPGQVYGHPWSSTTGKHVAGERPGDGGAAASEIARHAECVDCHNPHAIRRDPVPPPAPEATGALQGVARVRVSNGAAGSAPRFSYAGPEDSTGALEYEICFRCHSSFATQRPGGRDLAADLNPANASFHPVEARGTNPGILPGSFVRGWAADRLVRCTDCHAGDGDVRGPHASSQRHILAGPYADAAGRQPMTRDDLCFRCHAYATYADPAASPNSLAQSRFNPPNAAAGHVYHVATQGFGCFTCHETHGSPGAPNLVALGRSPGIAAFSREPSGGSCATTCHAVRGYGANYPR